MKAKCSKLCELLEKSSRCGDEREYAEMLRETLAQTGLFETVYVDRLFNVIAVGSGKRTILLEAHFDEISMIVADINDKGFIRAERVGGVDRRCLLSSEVTVNGLSGVFCSVPPHLMQKGDSEKVPEFRDIYIDVGLPAEEVREKIHIGDRIEFESRNAELLNGRVCGKALDNKASVYIILVVLEKLEKLIKENKLDTGISVLFAAQEEIGSRGAKTGAYGIDADEAIVLDVTFAKQKTPNTSDEAELGSGAVVERSAFFDKRITRRLMDIADEKKIAHTVHVEARAEGTDGDTIPYLRSGIPTARISLPLRYMHTPVETVDIADIEACADLICEYLKGGC